MKNESVALAAKSSPGVVALAYHYTIEALPVIISVLTVIYMGAQAYLSVKKVIREYKADKAEQKLQETE